MKEKLNQLLTKVKGLSLGQKIALAVAGALLFSIVIATLLWIHQPQYQLLYSNLSPEDAGSIINRLKEMHISYKLKNNGQDIYVPKDKVYELRLELASEGIPKGGQVGFEIFDHPSLGITDFIQKIDYQRALQGELARTIAHLQEVKWARVHLVIPKESLFSAEEKRPSASVLLALKPDQHLSNNQIKAIANLVAASVPGLDPKDVIIVDNSGHMLAGKKTTEVSAELIGKELKYQQMVESTLEKKVEDILGKAVGPGKVIAKVSVDMDFSKVEKNEELYNPNQTAIRSEQKIQEFKSGVQNLPMGIPGVVSNVPQIKKQVPITNTQSQPTKYQKSNQVINYEISRTIQHVVEPIGQIKRLSVAVLVDGIYKNNKFYPRSDDELEKFKKIVENTVGFSKQRGDQVEVACVPFAKVKAEQGAEVAKAAVEKKQMWVQIGLTVFKGLILLIMVFLLARLLKNFLAPPKEVPVSGELPKPVKEFEEAVSTLPKPKTLTEELQELREEVRKIAQKEPERIAQLARLWIREES